MKQGTKIDIAFCFGEIIIHQAPQSPNFCSILFNSSLCDMLKSIYFTGHADDSTPL